MIRGRLKSWLPKFLDIIMLGMPCLLLGNALGMLLEMMVYASVDRLQSGHFIAYEKVGMSFALLSIYYLRHKVWSGSVPKSLSEAAKPEVDESRDS